MRLTRLVFVCLLLSLVAPLSALAADRMYVGFQDDPSFRWREDRHAVIDEAAETNASVLRTTVYWYDVAPRRPSLASNPSDPAYNWSDLDEFVRNAQARGMDSYLTIWGTPGLGEPQQGAELRPAQLRRPDRFLSRGREPLQRAQPRLTVRPLLRRLERAEPRAVPRPDVRLEGPARRPEDVREALPRRIRGPQGQQPDGTGGRRRDLSEGQGQAVPGQDPGLARAGDVRAPRVPPEAADQVRRLGPPSVLRSRPGAEPEGALPERPPDDPSAVPEGHEEVVRPRRRHLDLRVRLRDEAGGAPRRQPRSPGRVRVADDQRSCAETPT